MKVRARIVIDEAAMKNILSELEPHLPYKITRLFVEPDRCVSIEMSFKGQKIEIKVKPKVYNGLLAIEIFKIFVAGGLNIAGLVSVFSSAIKEQFAQYPIGYKDNCIFFETIPSSYAGVFKNELLFDCNMEI